MRNLLFFVCITMGLLFLTQCDNNSIVDSREYLLNIGNSSGLPIDSVIIEREMEGVVDTLRFGEGDYNSADSSIAISFEVTGDPDATISVSYLCYSMGIPVIEKRSSYTNGDQIGKDGGVNPLAVQLLQEYAAQSVARDSISDQELATLFDSLFVDYTLRGQDSIAQVMYGTYVKRADADTALFIMALRDTLVGRGDQLPNLTLSDKLGIERETIRVYISVVDTLPALISSSTLSSSSVANPIGVSSNDTLVTVASSSSITIIAGSSQSIAIALKKFDFFGSISANGVDVGKVSLKLSGDSIPVPIVKEASYNSELMKYSGFVELETVGTNYSVEVLVQDSQLRLSGYKQYAFTSLSYSIEIAPFDAWNAKPWVAVDSLVDVSINDVISLAHSDGDSLNGGIITLVEWKHGANPFVAQIDSVFSIVAPDSAHSLYPVYIRVTDSDTNVVLDSVFVNVLLDAPLVSLAAVDTLIDISDSVHFSWSGTDSFGSIDEYKLKGASEQYWTTVTSGTSIALRSPDSEGVLKYYLQATDDDGNVVFDSAMVHAIIDPPVVSGVTLHGAAKQDSTLSVKYTYDDLLGDEEDSLATRIIWYSNGDSIIGERELEYAIQENDSGNVITVGVIPVAKEGFSKVGVELKSSPSSGVVGFNAPYVDSVWIEGTPLVGNTLTGKYAFKDVDGDSEGASVYKWYRDGTHVTSVSSDEYVLDQVDSGTVISFEVKPVEGTPYGKSGEAVTDTSDVYDFQDARDGQLYRTVVIGDQIWMKENLNFDTLDGSGSWCYGNDTENCSFSGRLYDSNLFIAEINSNSVPSGVKLMCPEGLHLPSENEWIILVEYVDSTSTEDVGMQLKSSIGWSDLNGNNSSGFSAVGGGYFPFDNYLNSGIWLSTTKKDLSSWSGLTLSAWDNNGTVATDLWGYGYSVRCLANKIPVAKIIGQIKPGVVDRDIVFDGSSSFGTFNDSTVEYSWRVTGSAIFPTNALFNYHPMTTGLKEVILNVTAGGISAEDTFSIWVHESITDVRDGQEYPIVTIGTQTWMASNLNFDFDYSFCINTLDELCNEHGRYYYRYSDNACLSGWHIPSDSEWQSFIDYLVVNTGNVMESIQSKYLWEDGSEGDDLFGFSGFASGYYNMSNFHKFGIQAVWRSTGEYGMTYGAVVLSDTELTLGALGLEGRAPIRCIKD